MPRAYASTVLAAPARDVWAVIRDFNALPNWNPGVKDSAIEDGQAADRVGCVRSFHLQDGVHLRERLLAFSDPQMLMTYNFEKTPFDVRNYCATLRLTPVTDGDRCFAEWWTTFDCNVAKTDEWRHTFADVIFKGGLDALKERFGG